LWLAARRLNCVWRILKSNRGDELVLREHDENNQLTGREIIKIVGTVAKTKEQIFWTQEEMDRVGFIVLSLLDAS
jgi:hypothetical protein